MSNLYVPCHVATYSGTYRVEEILDHLTNLVEAHNAKYPDNLITLQQAIARWESENCRLPLEDMPSLQPEPGLYQV